MRPATNKIANERGLFCVFESCKRSRGLTARLAVGSQGARTSPWEADAMVERQLCAVGDFLGSIFRSRTNNGTLGRNSILTRRQLYRNGGDLCFDRASAGAKQIAAHCGFGRCSRGRGESKSSRAARGKRPRKNAAAFGSRWSEGLCGRGVRWPHAAAAHCSSRKVQDSDARPARVIW